MQAGDNNAVVLAIVEQDGRSFLKNLQLKEDGTFIFLPMQINGEKVFSISVAKWLKEIITAGISK